MERGEGAERITRSMSQHVFYEEILCWTAANKLEISYNQLKYFANNHGLIRAKATEDF